MFAHSRIADRIKDIVSFFNNKYPQHRRAFVAILISSLCQDHVDWARIVDWLKIDEAQLKKDMRREAVFNFTANSRDWHKFTSSQLAHHIFTKFRFEEDLLVDVYTQIVRETAYASSDPRSGFDSRENLKELMKFRFLTKIFGDTSVPSQKFLATSP